MLHSPDRAYVQSILSSALQSILSHIFVGCRECKLGRQPPQLPRKAGSPTFAAVRCCSGFPCVYSCIVHSLLVLKPRQTLCQIESSPNNKHFRCSNQKSYGRPPLLSFSLRSRVDKLLHMATCIVIYRMSRKQTLCLTSCRTIFRLTISLKALGERVDVYGGICWSLARSAKSNRLSMAQQSDQDVLYQYNSHLHYGSPPFQTFDESSLEPSTVRSTQAQNLDAGYVDYQSNHPGHISAFVNENIQSPAHWSSTMQQLSHCSLDQGRCPGIVIQLVN